jgi:tRNA-splicing ligase RtcB
LANRELMIRDIVAALGEPGLVPAFEANVKVVSCHHNYVTWEYHYGENLLITRKGAVRAPEGDLGIIPGIMGARSCIVRGRGNPESFMSCSQGAERDGACRVTKPNAASPTTMPRRPPVSSDVKDADVHQDLGSSLLRFQSSLGSQHGLPFQERTH